jgi:hypothetical protein
VLLIDELEILIGSNPRSAGAADARGKATTVAFEVMRRPDSVPAWLHEAVTRCLHDMQQPTTVDLRLTLSDDGEHLEFLEADGSGSGFWLMDDQQGADLVVSLADFLQEQVFPETREAWGEARPACPGHQHPAAPAVLDEEAWWLCPVTNHRLAIIGTFEPARS